MFLFCSGYGRAMQTSSRQHRLAELRQSIAAIERKPALAARRDPLAAGADGDFPKLPGGLVQEIFTGSVREGAAALAFALGQARPLLTARRAGLFYLQLGEDAQALGVPYGPGLGGFGIAPERLIVVRAADMTEFLWAAEEIVACRAVAALLADVRGQRRLLDFTASRRLSLRAAASETTLFLLRHGARREASAAHLRWRLSPAHSGRRAYDGRAPGPARWRLALEKGRLGQARSEWMLEWTKNGFATLPVQGGPAAAIPGRPALPGAVPALLAEPISQAG